MRRIPGMPSERSTGASLDDARLGLCLGLSSSPAGRSDAQTTTAVKIVTYKPIVTRSRRVISEIAPRYLGSDITTRDAL
jgi:hypothetical protein